LKTNIGWVCLDTSVIPAIWEAEVGGSWSEVGPEQKVQDSIRKFGGVAPVVEHSSSKHKALISNPSLSPAKKKEGKKAIKAR
jgi:hypothetical protein